MTDSLNWEHFQQALQEADQATKDWINSGIIGEYVNSLIQSGTPEAKRYELIRALTHYKLGLLSDVGLNETLSSCGISRASVDGLFTDSKHAMQAETNNHNTQGNKILDSDIAETEAALAGLRTMAGDMKVVQQQTEEPVYSSTQSALLGEADRAAAPTADAPAIPPVATPDTPRNIPVKSTPTAPVTKPAAPTPATAPRAIPPRKAASGVAPRWESES